MTLSELRDAVFWEHSLCLDCTATFDSALEACPVCGGEHLVPATKILALVEPIIESVE